MESNRLTEAIRRPALPSILISVDRSCSWRGLDFDAHVGGLVSRLSGPPGRWLLVCDSSYAFAVGLWALWRTGHVAVLPSNRKPGHLAALDGTFRGIVSDTSLSLNGLPCLSPLDGRGSFETVAPLLPSQTAIEIFTSGSTGAPKRVAKTFAQLEDEVAVLEKTFGARLGNSIVHATVSHHHIYGLLFRVLWPLSSGRPFSAQTVLLWEDLVQGFSGNVSLISSPAHLERCSSVVSPIPWKAVFSSGGPLSREAALDFKKRTGVSPVEILGSTETGGVGWRESPDDSWMPLDGVILSLTEDACLRVTSSYAGGTEVLGDRGELLSDGRFRLLGRADRIVKIAEKRVSLHQMERHLEELPEVHRAAVTVLEFPGRVSLGAVLVLTEEGKTRLNREGRASFMDGVRQALSTHFDEATLPRTFRTVEDFPRDSQGKTSLQALFSPPTDSLERLGVLLSEEGARWDFRVPESLVYLEGHFPSFPVVPGVVQVQWVMKFAEEWLGQTFEVKRLEAVKFKDLLRPGQEFSLNLSYSRGTSSPGTSSSGAEEIIRFSLGKDEVLFSSGRCVVCSPPRKADPPQPPLAEGGGILFNPCLLIPFYNHGREIGPLLEMLAPLSLPCLVVDDGSDESSSRALRESAVSLPWVEILRRADNGGKGVAVVAGLAWAKERGFTHGIQLDADGQHDPAEVPRFLEAARRSPQGLIIGQPIFDSSVPPSRFWGRKISQFWVWVETLSFDIQDPLCGFRVYPIHETLSLAKEVSLGQRMDFDPDVAVRLHWRGVPVVNVPTPIRYKPGGLSHFDLWGDNLRISWMNTRLFWGMLKRFPQIIYRKFCS
jgi:hypothetical protein